MRLIATFVLALSGTVALGACTNSDPVDDNAANVTGVPAANSVAGEAAAAPSADGRAPANATAGPPPSAAADASATLPPIPAAMHGRWALSPGDCTSRRGDNKGLMTVSSDRLSFYESAAVPVRDADTSDNRFSAVFAFTGEGQNWTRYQALALGKDGLVRTETKPNASFTYAKCA